MKKIIGGIITLVILTVLVAVSLYFFAQFTAERILMDLLPFWDVATTIINGGLLITPMALINSIFTDIFKTVFIGILVYMPIHFGVRALKGLNGEGLFKIFVYISYTIISICAALLSLVLSAWLKDIISDLISFTASLQFTIIFMEFADLLPACVSEAIPHILVNFVLSILATIVTKVLSKTDGVSTKVIAKTRRQLFVWVALWGFAISAHLGISVLVPIFIAALVWCLFVVYLDTELISGKSL